MKCAVAVKCDEVNGSVTLKQTENRSGEPPKVFTFDRVFGPESKQTDVYNDAARAIVESVLEGYNGTLYCVILLVYRIMCNQIISILILLFFCKSWLQYPVASNLIIIMPLEEKIKIIKRYFTLFKVQSLHMVKQELEKHSQWKVFELSQTSEELFQTLLLIYLVTFQRWMGKQGKHSLF